ncbi:MAG: sugar transferase [Candidatus Adiutrix sp.]|jgi:lipopolysaccharide/colanic/teichoic acid biosynthesis glycosyltransferase|nr:sugar transferase [Candidatus Adiutrix sp.]
MVWKRLFDLAGSAGLLALLWPLMLVLALAVKLDSPGPALFRQTRVGRGGLDFDILKFRTMTVLPEASAGRFDAGDARRVTRLGRLLRRGKLDELPQLLNVLKGEMSLVGPRPEIRRWVEIYPERWRAALQVRPGLTDEASVRFRHEEDILAAAADPERCYREMILPRKLDLYEKYAARPSFKDDLKIIWATLKAL